MRTGGVEAAAGQQLPGEPAAAGRSPAPLTANRLVPLPGGPSTFSGCAAIVSPASASNAWRTMRSPAVAATVEVLPRSWVRHPGVRSGRVRQGQAPGAVGGAVADLPDDDLVGPGVGQLARAGDEAGQPEVGPAAPVRPGVVDQRGGGQGVGVGQDREGSRRGREGHRATLGLAVHERAGVERHLEPGRRRCAPHLGRPVVGRTARLRAGSTAFARKRYAPAGRCSHR